MVVHWRRVGANPRAREQVAKLIGSEATLLMGSPGGAWEDQGALVSPPPLDSVRSGAVMRYRRGRAGMRRPPPAGAPRTPRMAGVRVPRRRGLAPPRPLPPAHVRI